MSFHSLLENTGNGQILPCHELCVTTSGNDNQRPNRVLKIAVNTRGAPMTQPLDPASLDVKGLQVLLQASCPGGITLADLAKQQDINLSYGQARSLAMKLESKGWLTHTRTPHRNEGMPAAYVFHLASSVLVEELQFELDKGRQEPLQVKSQQFSEIVVNHQQFEVEDLNHKEEPKPQSILSLETVLDSFNSSSRLSHVLILATIAKAGNMAFSEVSRQLGEKKQTTHSRLERLRREGILDRIKPSGYNEYQYFISSKISSQEIDDLLLKAEGVSFRSKVSINDSTSLDLPSSKTMPTIEQAEVSSPMNSASSPHPSMPASFSTAWEAQL